MKCLLAWLETDGLRPVLTEKKKLKKPKSRFFFDKKKNVFFLSGNLCKEKKHVKI